MEASNIDDEALKRKARREALAQKIAGIAAIYAIEKGVAKGLSRAKMKVPSSLVTMLLWLGGLKTLEVFDSTERAEAVVAAFSPAVGFLGKWMTLFLTPPLVMLPTAVRKHAANTTAAQWQKLACVHALGWALSCTTSALIARALWQPPPPHRVKRADSTSPAEPLSPPPPAATMTRALSADAQVFSDAVANQAEVEKSSQDESSCGVGGGDSGGDQSAAGVGKEDVKAEAAAHSSEPVGPPPPAPASASFDPLLTRWLQFTAASYCLQTLVGRKPAAVGTTVSALVAASTLLPASVTKVAHPLVVAAAVTGASVAATGVANGDLPADALADYMNGQGPLSGGAGDFVAALMNAAVSCLGIRVFEARQILMANWRPIVGGGGVGAALSLFGTAWACGVAKLPPPLSLALVHRSVMSALGMAGAEQVGASPTLAVASIILTGVYGASLGPSLLDRLGFDGPKSASLSQKSTTEKAASAAKAEGSQGRDHGGGGQGAEKESEHQERALEGGDEEVNRKGDDDGDGRAVVRGVSMGQSSHAIGTATLMGRGEESAAAVASVALCAAGVVHTTLLALPPVRRLVHALVARKLPALTPPRPAAASTFY